MDKKSNNKESYIETLNKGLDVVKKYIKNASSYYETYASQAPVILQEVKKQYAEAQATLDQVKEVLSALDNCQNNIAEIMQDTKTDAKVLTKRPK